MRVSAAHVLQPVLQQSHRKSEPAREIGDQNRMLDAALDAVAATDVDVVVHAHGRGRERNAMAIWSGYFGIWIEA